MDIRSSIEDTRKGFEESFASRAFYNRQTQDSDQMEKILKYVKIRGRMRILDLGTGSGYLAFPMAKKNPDCEVIGLDIVSTALGSKENGNFCYRVEGHRGWISFVLLSGIHGKWFQVSYNAVEKSVIQNPFVAQSYLTGATDK